MLQNLQSTELVYPGTQVLRSGVISGRDNVSPNVQRRYFGCAQRRAAPMELPESGFRSELGIELTVANTKSIRIFPNWYAIFELNYLDAPNIWGCSVETVTQTKEY